LTIFRQQADLIHALGADSIDRLRLRSIGLAEIFAEALPGVRDCAGLFRIMFHEIGILAQKREQWEGARRQEVLLRELSFGDRVGSRPQDAIIGAEESMATDIDRLLREFADGRTDLAFALIEAGVAPDWHDQGGVSLLRWCAYYGDVSAIRFLLSRGAALASLGPNLDLNGACFHGHWRLCRFLIEQGADVSCADDQTGETPLHSALCTTDRVAHDKVLEVLLSSGANPRAVTKTGAETGGFMRDARTKGETPLHRAAAYGNEATIELLLKHGAQRDALDAFGDSPLSWANWHLRPDPILRLLCYGPFKIRPDRQSMRANLIGKP
jgi:uncharacterized protein